MCPGRVGGVELLLSVVLWLLSQGEAALQFHAAQGAAQLSDEIARIGPQHNFTRLVPDLSSGEDPDDAFSRVPYEKGFYFLYYLQVGCWGHHERYRPAAAHQMLLTL